MARPLRFQYPGALYHVMARGDGGRVVFETDDDRRVFLARLGEACGRCGWRVHAWVLMGNHFHLLLETPEPNLVVGMKWLLGTFSQGWNRARGRHGHVFQGRYKAVPVQGSGSGSHYFRIVADYIHLNPARAGLAGGGAGRLAAYRWSSLASYAKVAGPEWLETGRVLKAFQLATDARGGRAYADWLEARASNPGGAIDEKAQAALRRGWYLGRESFRDRLLEMMAGAKAGAARPRRFARSPGAERDHGEREAERLLKEAARELGLPVENTALAALSKSDARKAVIAALLRKRTTVDAAWVAMRLETGHPGSLSRLVKRVGEDRKLARQIEHLEEMLCCEN